MKQTAYSTGTSDWISRWIEGCARHRAIVIVLATLLTMAAGAGLWHLRMCENPLGDMYPSDHPFIPVLTAIGSMAPEPRLLIVILDRTHGDIYNPSTIAKIDRITKTLMGMDGVLPDSVTSLTRRFDHYENSADGMSIEPILGKKWPETPEECYLLKRRVAVNPMGPGRYVAYDGSAAMITAALDDIEKRAEKAFADLPDHRKKATTLQKFKAAQSDAFEARLLASLNELKRTEDDGQHTLYFMGPQIIRAQMTAMGRWQIPVAAVAMCISVVALLALRFKTVRGVIVPLAAFLLSLVWTLGVYAILGLAFNPMALLFPVVLSVCSLGYASMIVEAYSQQDGSQPVRAQTIACAYRDLPIVQSICTVGCAAIALCVSSVPMFRGLGVLALCWGVGAVGIMMCLVPAILTVCSSQRLAKVRFVRSEALSIGKAKAGTYGPLRYTVIGLVLLLGAIGGMCVKRLPVGDNTPGTSFLRPSHPWNQCFSVLARKFMGPYQLLVYVKAKEQGGLLDPGVLTAMAEFTTYLKDRCGARDSIGLDMMISMARVTLMDGNPKWQTLPNSRRQIERLAGLVVEQGGVDEFVDKTFTQATLSPFFPACEQEHIDTYVDRIARYIAQSGSESVTFSIGGGLLGMTKVLNDATTSSYGKAMVLACAAVAIISVLWTRSLLLAVCITFPLVLAHALLWAIMAAAGMPLSLALIPGIVVSTGFSSIFGYYLLWSPRDRQRYVAPMQWSSQRTHEGRESVVLFLGVLAAVGCLPWTMIGLKFQATMVLSAAVTFMLQCLVSMLMIPFFAHAIGKLR